MWFFGLIVVLLIGAVAVVASGRWGAMSTAYDDRPDMTVPARQALTSTDIESARFAVGLRGYRMDEVDTLLERVAREVAERDRRIADLERAVAPIVEAPDGAGFTSRESYDPAEFDDTGVQKPILVGGDFPGPEPAEEPVGAEQAAVEPIAPEAADEEPDTRELPKTSLAAADEYERLQAEARALLEAQSQPGAPRRTPAEPTQPAEPKTPPAAPQQPEAQVQEQAAPPVEPQPAPQPPEEWQPSQSSYQLREQRQPSQSAHQQQPIRPADQQPEQQVESPQQESAPADQPPAQPEQEQEGWQFWPPADQQPAAPVWPENWQQADDAEERHTGAPGEGASRRPS